MSRRMRHVRRWAERQGLTGPPGLKPLFFCLFHRAKARCFYRVSLARDENCRSLDFARDDKGADQWMK
uniref:Uncharacterized protein n=1 Tax=Paracidobacterium acidisoli TaxID=2303751 RepID=A0A372ISG9_9BACT